ncbi:MAG TPA: leucyl/phenylalanyl-tRNA--protein transferase [Acidimicrobiia bacterium]|nr:leucyl/phenylalanyl-tRNA--protein transferase [Acidimicrobiia bacterium]
MPPIDPTPTAFEFPPVDEWALDDLVGVGADLAPGTILEAYRRGLFPMPLEDGALGWWSPIDRAVLPFTRLRISRSLARSCRRFTVSVDADAAAVIEGCADPNRPHGWITEEMAQAYLDLHRLGWVHSFEVWDHEAELVGGLYGVAIGGLFCGESMFHRVADASKVALVHLVSLLAERGGRLLDIQWLTPHLASLGAEKIGRQAYQTRLPEALAGPDPFEGLDDRSAEPEAPA